MSPLNSAPHSGGARPSSLRGAECPVSAASGPTNIPLNDIQSSADDEAKPTTRIEPEMSERRLPDDPSATTSRALTTVSSSATLCHLSDDEDDHFGRRKTKESLDLPATINEAAPPPPPPPFARKTIAPPDVPPPIPAPDAIAYFDPASAGGGGPLRRITTQQRERAEAEARDRAERAHREALGLPTTPVSEGYSAGGILNRLRSGSNASRRKPRFVTPLLQHEEETASRTSGGFRPTLTPTWSANALSDTGSVKSSRDISPAVEEGSPAVNQYVYPDGGYGWVVVICCMTLAGASMGQGMNYGAYQSYYTKVAFPGASSAYIGVAGTMNAFVSDCREYSTDIQFMNFAAFFFGRMGDRFGYKVGETDGYLTLSV